VHKRPARSEATANAQLKRTPRLRDFWVPVTIRVPEPPVVVQFKRPRPFLPTEE
jgi:hypothetical protein